MPGSMGLRITGTAATKSLLDRIIRGLRDSEWIVAVGVDYAVFVEFGTRYMRAQPFMRPAAEQVMRTEFRQIERTSNDVPQIVERTARAIERRSKAMAAVDTGRMRASIRAYRVK